MLGLWSYVAVALIAASGSWFVQGWRYDAKELARVEQQQEDERTARKVAEEAAAAHEADKGKTDIQYVEVIKTVTKLVDRPVYKNICLDQDGLDAINGKKKPVKEQKK